MDVFVIGITGGVGGLLAEQLRARGDGVHGLVRRQDDRARLRALGVDAHVGDLADMTVERLAAAFGGVDAVVFAAGSNGGPREVTRAVDGEGLVTAIGAARLAGVERLVLVSVFPEAWRERDLGEDEEYYFAVKKDADVALSRSGLDWLVLRPSLLVDGPPAGTVSLGPAESHGEITRADVAGLLVELLHEPRITRRILEANTGPIPIADAVRAQLVAGPG